jgi:hypothetical protein
VRRQYPAFDTNEWRSERLRLQRAAALMNAVDQARSERTFQTCNSDRHRINLDDEDKSRG